MAKNDKDAIRELKAINRSQQKELARLRKELDRRQDLSDDYKEALMIADEATKATKESKKSNCPDCGSRVQVGEFILTCTGCNWRKRKNVK